MAWFVKIDTKEDLAYIQRMVNNWNVRCKENISAYVEYAEMFDRLDQAFNNAVEALEVAVTKEAVPEVKVRKARQPPVLKFNLCTEHTLYKALRPPRTGCEGCWAAFKRLAGADRAKQARLKFDRNKRKVNEANN